MQHTNYVISIIDFSGHSQIVYAQEKYIFVLKRNTFLLIIFKQLLYIYKQKLPPTC